MNPSYPERDIGLMLRQIFDSSAGADLVSQIQIRFSDVTVVSVARLDLKGVNYFVRGINYYKSGQT